MASDAVRLTETLRVATAAIGAQVKGKTSQQLLSGGRQAVAGGDFADADKLAGAAIIAAPKDPSNWLAYAGIAAAADDAKANDRYEFVTQGATAAYAAYQHSTTPDAQAAALAMLADLLARHEQWRPALDALKASLDRHDLVDVRKTYEAMRAEHGFRILDYKVDNESSLPRVCFNFSEALARRTDFSPYVAVSGSSDTAISNEDQQICVEGLKHGERYAIVLRQGLPSAVGDSAEVGRLRDLCARPLAAGAFRRPGLRAAAPGTEGRAARHRQHREGLHRRLSRRRPQSVGDRQSRRFSEAHRFVAR